MKYERTNGEMHDIEPTILTKTVAEMIGYTADCHEHVLENGDLDIHTQFYMERPEEGE